jgi:hypothetical protein
VHACEIASICAGDTHPEATPQSQLTSYLQRINSLDFSEENINLQQLCVMKQFSYLSPLFSSIFCSPASSAPVERIFSHSGLIMRPNRARMTDTLLERLVYLKCNADFLDK